MTDPVSAYLDGRRSYDATAFDAITDEIAARAAARAEGAEQVVDELHDRLRGAVKLVRDLRQFVPYEKPEQGSLPGWIVEIQERADAFLDADGGGDA